MANIGILEVNYKPLPKPIEHNLIEVFRLDFPVAVHSRRKFLPLNLWNEHSTRVIVGIIGSSFHRVLNVFFLREPRTSFGLLDNCIHILPGDALVAGLGPVFIFILSSFELLGLDLRIAIFNNLLVLLIRFNFSSL